MTYRPRSVTLQNFGQQPIMRATRFIRSAQCNIILLGAPGGGKGTISKKIMKKYAFEHISTGDLLRRHIQDKTDLGVAAKEFMERGQLVPNALVMDILQNFLSSSSSSTESNRYLLDGFPRTIEQADLLRDIMAIQSVIYLDIPHETIMQRLSERYLHPASGRIYNLTYNPPKQPGIDDETGEPLVQREDDKPETVKKRLIDFENQTQPLIEYYKKVHNVAVRQFRGTESDVIFVDVDKFLSSELQLSSD